MMISRNERAEIAKQDRAVPSASEDHHSKVQEAGEEERGAHCKAGVLSLAVVGEAVDTREAPVAQGVGEGWKEKEAT
jgi:hypothetical protein